MKKVYTTPEYKARKRRKTRKVHSNPRRKRKDRTDYTLGKHRVSNRRPRPTYTHYSQRSIKPAVVAPVDFRLLANTEECLRFFSKLRQNEYLSYVRNVKFVEMSLSNVLYIDYSTISILTAISDDLKLNKIILRGNFPKDESCSSFLKESGFLNKMVDEHGNKYPESEKSDMLFFEKGSDRLTKIDNRRISNVVQNIVKHLTGKDGHCQAIRTVLLEICGNTIEWSGAENNQWLLGVKYENDKVIVTVTDVGKGIIKTLHKQLGQQFAEFIARKTNDHVLIGAFEKKYGSKSKKANRNKGLPSIKKAFDNSKLQELKVLTNNVILHFDSNTESRTIESGTPWFRGTFYRWTISNKCIEGQIILL